MDDWAMRVGQTVECLTKSKTAPGWETTGTVTRLSKRSFRWKANDGQTGKVSAPETAWANLAIINAKS